MEILFCRIIGPEKPDLSLFEDREWVKQKHWAQGLAVKVVDDLHTIKDRPDVPVYGVLPLNLGGIPEPYNADYGFVLPGTWLVPIHASEIDASEWQLYEHPALGKMVYPKPDEGLVASFMAQRAGFAAGKPLEQKQEKKAQP